MLIKMASFIGSGDSR